MPSHTEKSPSEQERDREREVRGQLDADGNTTVAATPRGAHAGDHDADEPRRWLEPGAPQGADRHGRVEDAERPGDDAGHSERANDGAERN